MGSICCAGRETVKYIDTDKGGNDEGSELNKEQDNFKSAVRSINNKSHINKEVVNKEAAKTAKVNNKGIAVYIKKATVENKVVKVNNKAAEIVIPAKIHDSNKVEANNSEEEEEEDHNKLKDRLSKAKKKVGENRKSSYIQKRIEAMQAKYANNGENEIKKEIKEIDEYTRILINKQAVNRKTRKFTKFNFKV